VAKWKYDSMAGGLAFLLHGFNYFIFELGGNVVEIMGFDRTDTISFVSVGLSSV
jgi:hypothetical protein